VGRHLLLWGGYNPESAARFPGAWATADTVNKHMRLVAVYTPILPSVPLRQSYEQITYMASNGTGCCTWGKTSPPSKTTKLISIAEGHCWNFLYFPTPTFLYHHTTLPRFWHFHLQVLKTLYPDPGVMGGAL